jgi:hypothetical protein
MQAERKTINTPHQRLPKNPTMRSDQARSLVRMRPAGLRGRSRSRRTRRELPPRRRASTVPDLSDGLSDSTADGRRDFRGEPTDLRRNDVELAVENRYQRGQDAVPERDDELDQRLPVHTCSTPRQLGTETCEYLGLDLTGLQILAEMTAAPRILRTNAPRRGSYSLDQRRL